MTDTPRVDLVLSKLAAEVKAKRPESLFMGISKSKRIEFKYPLTYKRTERQSFMKEIADALDKTDDEPLLKRMLSETDFELYDSEDLDDDIHVAVMTSVIEHFELEKELKSEGKGSGSDIL